MGMSRDWQALLDEAEAQGWTRKPTKSGWLYLSPDGESKVMVHRTPSDRRALPNARARFRAGGLTEEPNE